jgi:phosphoglycolate phosphatase-like HAD superfamily hydrolase
MSAPALVLFDIDGTLLRRAGPHHREAIIQAVRRVTGLETTMDGVPVHGMLDPVIISIMMERAGASRALIRRSLAAIYRSAEAHYQRHAPDLTRKTCPGAKAALERLARRDVALGLVTGNLTRIGWRKLERAGLRDYFRFGAFGEMAPTRSGLARMAVREARRRGWIAKGSPIALIGDAPADIIAAKDNGLRSIAVNTGLATLDELKEHTPDFLLEDLRLLRVEMVA